MDSKKSSWIKGYTGMYRIYSDGTIISFKQDKLNGRVMVHKKIGIGYLAVDLIKDGKHNSMCVHKLLGQTFVKNPHPRKLKRVIFIDGDITNLKLDNLAWAQSKKKQNLTIRGKKVNLKANGFFSSKFNENDIRYIAHVVADNNYKSSLTQLAKEFKVSIMTIHRLQKTPEFLTELSKIDF